jgi:hypothetical protein
MWPKGSQLESYELLNATITNQGQGTQQNQSNYFAHVLARPNSFIGCVGYEADVEVHDHKGSDGFVPLLMSVLAASHQDNSEQGFFMPQSRVVARLSLADAHEFEQRLKGRAA